MIYYYIALFLAFGAMGWILDTGYRTIEIKKYTTGTWLPYFALIYAVGGMILFFIFKNTAWSIWWQIIIGWILMILLEFFSGHLSVKILRRRFWDYRLKARWHLAGHIDALHSFYWLMLTILFRMLFPYLPL